MFKPSYKTSRYIDGINGGKYAGLWVLERTETKIVAVHEDQAALMKIQRALENDDL